jgi:CBS domain containing-hemolysin-like protein
MNGAEILLIGEILLLILLLGMSAFFSSSEMSLFSLSRAKLMSFKDSESNVERKIHFLMEDYTAP